ncbi:MAG: hypothetical protein ACO2YP_08510, partial [Pseudomonadales bacterium]
MNPAEPRAKLLDRPDLDAEYLKLFRAVLRDGREDVARRALHRAILCGPRFGKPYEVFGSALCRGFGNAFFSEISVQLLRYFNPVGSYKKIIGES